MSYWENRHKEEEGKRKAQTMEGLMQECPACHHFTLTKVTVIIYNDVWECANCHWSGKPPLRLPVRS